LEKAKSRLKYFFKYQYKLDFARNKYFIYYRQVSSNLIRQSLLGSLKLLQFFYYFRRKYLVPLSFRYIKKHRKYFVPVPNIFVNKQIRLIKYLQYIYIKFKIWKYFDLRVRQLKIKIVGELIAKKLIAYRQCKQQIKYFKIRYAKKKSFLKLKMPYYYRNYFFQELPPRYMWITSSYLHNTALKFKWSRIEHLKELQKSNFLYKRIVDFFKNSGKLSKHVIKRDILTQSFIQLRYIHFRHVSRSRYRLRKTHIAIRYLFPKILLTISLKKLFLSAKIKVLK